MATHKAPEDAEAALEDLEVKEVSVVDRPAIGRKFLVVKNADGDVQLIEEEAMSRGMIPAAAAAEFGRVPAEKDDTPAPAPAPEEQGGSELADIFEVIFTDTDDDDDPPEPGAHPVGVEPITKTAKADALKATSDAMGSLTTIVAALKKADASGEVPAEQAKALQECAKALTEAADKMGDGADDKTQAEQAKSAGDALQKASEALQKLVQLVSRIKELDDGVDKVDDGIVGSVRSLGKVLATIAGKQEPADDKAPANPQPPQLQQQAKRLEVFKGAVDANGDRDIILKVGASMRSTRLSKLRAAVKALNELMGELDPTKDEKAKTTKVDLSPLTSKLDTLAEAITKSNETLKAVDDRVAKIEQEDTTVPAGNAAPQTEPIDKKDKKKGLWDGLFA